MWRLNVKIIPLRRILFNQNHHNLNNQHFTQVITLKMTKFWHFQSAASDPNGYLLRQRSKCHFNIKIVFPGMGIRMIEIRQLLSWESLYWWDKIFTGLILGLHPANERRRYKVTASLIGFCNDVSHWLGAKPRISPVLILKQLPQIL